MSFSRVQHELDSDNVSLGDSFGFDKPSSDCLCRPGSQSSTSVVIELDDEVMQACTPMPAFLDKDSLDEFGSILSDLVKCTSPSLLSSMAKACSEWTTKPVLPNLKDVVKNDKHVLVSVSVTYIICITFAF